MKEPDGVADVKSRHVHIFTFIFIITLQILSLLGFGFHSELVSTASAAPPQTSTHNGTGQSGAGAAPLSSTSSPAEAKNGKINSQPTQQPVDQPTKQPVDQSSKHSESPTSKDSESPTSKHSDSPTSKHSDSPTSKHSDSPTSKHSDATTSKHSDATTSKHSESPKPKHSESSVSKHSESPKSKHSESPVSKHAEKNLAKVSHNLSERHVKSVKKKTDSNSLIVHEGIQTLSKNLFSDNQLANPLIQMNTSLQIGEDAAGKNVFLKATGLLPGSTVSLVIHSSPQVLGTATVNSSGAVSLTAVTPAGLPSGDHKIVAVATRLDSQPIEAVSAFRINSVGVVIAYAPPALVSKSIIADQSSINRALNAGKPLFDINLHPGVLASIAIAGASIFSLVGFGGLTGFPRSGLETLAEVNTKKLKVVKRERIGRGDQSITWKFPGTPLTDSWIRKITQKTETFSALLPRVLVDGTWARAVFGSAGFGLWIFGITLGVISSTQVKYQALPPSLPYVLIIVAISILDSAAGVMAWIAIAGLALFTGHITSWPDLRTVLGMFVLFSSIPLLAHAMRPMRRNLDGSWMQRFDRLADYAMPPIFLAFAATSMFKALNGFSGLELINASQFGALKLVVIIFFLIRMLLEDLTLFLYPQRSLACQPEKVAGPTRIATWGSIITKLSLFALFTAPFFGLSKYTLFTLALTASMLIIKFYEKKLPNSPRVHKWYPRGIANFLMMLVVGVFVTSLVLGAHPSDQQIKSTYALIMLPGIIAGLISIFGREGGIWPENWYKRLLGVIVWFTAVGLVLGFITL